MASKKKTAKIEEPKQEPVVEAVVESAEQEQPQAEAAAPAVEPAPEVEAAQPEPAAAAPQPKVVLHGARPLSERAVRYINAVLAQFFGKELEGIDPAAVHGALGRYELTCLVRDNGKVIPKSFGVDSDDEAAVEAALENPEDLVINLNAALKHSKLHDRN